MNRRYVCPSESTPAQRLFLQRRNSTGAIVTAEGSGNDSIRRRASNQESVASAPLVSVDRGADAGEMDGDGRESRSNSYARSRRVSRALRVSLRAVSSLAVTSIRTQQVVITLEAPESPYPMLTCEFFASQRSSSALLSRVAF